MTRIRLIADGGRIAVERDGATLFTLADAAPYTRGWFGLRTTVPQVFIDGRHIGGSDDLAALDRQGGLDPLLAA